MDSNADQLIGTELAENYRALLADKNRGLTPERLAKQAEAAGAKDVAAWARAQAAKAGEDITPTDAKPDTATTTRDPEESTSDEQPAAAESDDDLDEQLAPAADAEEAQADAAAKPAPAKPTPGKSSKR